MNQSEKGDLFAGLHQPGNPLLMPNPWDIGSTVMMSNLGFKALATTSAGYAYSIGRLDGDVGRDTMLTHAAQLAGATDLPVSADLENGWGHAPDTVADTIRLAWDAGLVGGSIEDATGQPDTPIYEFGAACERVRAAAEATRALPGRFMLCARAENFLFGRPDLNDTIARLQAYQDAGADLLYAPGLRSLDDVRAIVSAIDRPLNVLASTRLSVADLATTGVARISLGSAMARAAYGAMIAASSEMQGDGSFTFISRSPGFADLNKLVDPG